MTGESSVVLTAHIGPALVITLNRPAVLNAVTRSMCETIADALDTAESNPEVRAAILTGTGARSFSSGADLRDVTGEPIDATSARGRYGFGGIVRHPFTKPLIAAVNGLAYGGGCETLLRCDVVLAAGHATFALPEVTRGVVAGGGGAVRLARAVGPRLAAEMLLTGHPIDARRALASGLITGIHEDPLTAALELCQTIADNAPLAIAATLRLLRADEDAAWEANAAEITALLTAEDVQEGAAAFLEKRRPQWRGR